MDFAEAEAKMAALALRYEGTTWKTFMEPTVARPVPLDLVAQWWSEVHAWRTVLWETGSPESNMYDGDPRYRVPNSTIRTKFPWLTIDDEIEVQRLAVALRPAPKRRRR